MAVVKPFRAVRYDERRAGPISTLIAPPYDVIDAVARARYLASSPYNVVHLTLPDERAGRGGDVARVARRGRARRRTTSRRSGGSRRTTSGRTASRGRAGRARLRAAPRAVRERGRAPARAHACRPEGGTTAAAPRSTRRGRADLPPLRRQRSTAPPAIPTSTSSSTACATGCGGSTGTVPDALAGRAASDRGRSPSLRDDARLPRRGRLRGERVDAGRRLSDRPGGADDLPHAPDRGATRPRRRRSCCVRRRRALRASWRSLRRRGLPA